MSTKLVRSSRKARRRSDTALLGLQLSGESRLGKEKDRFRLELVQKLRRPSDCPPEQFPRLQDQERMSRRFLRALNPNTAGRLLAAVAHPRRIHILKLLHGGAACYRTLVKATGLKAGPLYHHLSELRSAGLIGPRNRDVYMITRKGQRLAVMILAMQKLSSTGRGCG